MNQKQNMACLFDSLTPFLRNKEGEKPSSQSLREEICNYLELNKDVMDDITNSELTVFTDNMNLKDYVREMRKPSTWGSAVEIKTFCEIYKIKVVVIHLMNNRSIEFVPSRKGTIYSIPEHTIYLRYNGSHYTPWKIE